MRLGGTVLICIGFVLSVVWGNEYALGLFCLFLGGINMLGGLAPGSVLEIYKQPG